MVTARKNKTQKKIEPTLNVFVQIGTELVLAGALSLEGTKDRFMAAFAYHESYLRRARTGQAFALDPINLPLRPEPFHTESRYQRLGVLFDAAPDAWGRTIMANEEKISPSSLLEEHVLLKGKGSGVGAILFSHPRAESIDPSVLAMWQNQLTRAEDIEAMYEATRAIMFGNEIPDGLRAQLMSSWDVGGARPKVVVLDKGVEWIAKFPSPQDTYSRQRVEFANLTMANDIGIRTPLIRLHELNDGDCALLVRRFDRDTDEHGQILRRNYLSAVSLISPPSGFDKREMDTAYGASIFSYARIADVIRRVSTNPIHDLQELYARMVLNVMVRNTDDHLKNTGFLMDKDGKNNGYRLSPLFDVVTQEGGTKHMLHIGVGPKISYAETRLGTLQNILCASTKFGLKSSVAQSIVKRVIDVVQNRERYYRDAGMNANEIEMVQARVVLFDDVRLS